MRTLESHFRLTKTQRNGIFLFLIVLVGSEILTQWYESKQTETSVTKEIPEHILALQKEIDAENSNLKIENSKYVHSKIELSNFNPNELSKQDWINLGFSQKQVDVIFNYKNSLGGDFSSKQQIKECFVVSNEKFIELQPYILLPDYKKSKKSTIPIERNSIYQYPTTKIHLTKFNPNQYSKQNWVQIGFSEKQADVILNYKQSLGGLFTSKQQIKECFVISESKYLELKPYLLLPEKSNLKIGTNNQKTDNQKQVTNIDYANFNPNEYRKQDWVNIGFSSKQAQTILNYKRSLGGQFATKEQIKQCYVIDEEKFKEIEPYLNFPDQPKTENQIEHINAQTKTNNEQLNTNNQNPKTINEVTADDLFPYVSTKKVAYTLVKYRNSIGGFENKHQVEKVYNITEQEVEKILAVFPLP